MARLLSAEQASRAAEALDAAVGFARSRDYRGTDPYAALSSPLARRVPTSIGKRLVTQGVKQAPPFVHRMLGFDQLRMRKALALFSLAYSKLDALRPEGEAIAEELLASIAIAMPGYEFPVAVRWGGYTTGTPNGPATAVVIEAIHAFGLWGGTNPPQVAEDFLLNFSSPLGYLKYVPGHDVLIHNANMLGVRSGLRLGVDPELLCQAAMWTLRFQRIDGSWNYGEGKRLSWNDSFHTVNILESLLDVLPILPGHAEDQLRAGVRNWLETYFAESGQVCYYPRDQKPIVDVHNVATSLFGLVKLGSVDNRCWELIQPNLDYLLEFQQPSGGFATPGKPIFMRWNQGHAVHALAHLTAHGDSAAGSRSHAPQGTK